MNILRLKEVLNEKGVTGKELALQLGVSQNTVSNIVNGYNFPKSALLIEMANILDIDIKDLFVSTREKDLSDPIIALKEIKRIVDKVNTD